jgi:beta-galactosidase
MNKFYKILFALLIVNFSMARESFKINEKWSFTYGYEVRNSSAFMVNIPHTWNQKDANSGNLDYYRGLGNYEKEIFAKDEWRNKRVFIKFDGVNTVSHTFINNKVVGVHKGGYTSFIYEITDFLKYGKKNKVLVRVSNALNLDIMPLLGDFNFYGGIYRDVHIIVTEKSCISPLDFASSGVYLSQYNVSKKKADVKAKILVNNADSKKKMYKLRIKVLNGKKEVIKRSQNIAVKAGEEKATEIKFQITRPRLWNGVKDPFIYKTVVELWDKKTKLDEVVQPLGLRYYSVDKNKGFFLNGEHIKLQGVCRHQDRSDFGNALREIHHEEDVKILTEMGANAIRLSHYPHAPYFYDLLDKNGIITWSEIPFVGPGGYKDRGFVNTPEFKANGLNQLEEMIKQNYNHPGILMWGLFNELKPEDDNPIPYLKELQKRVYELDDTRITTSASFRDGEINDITDIICWNKYYGWYGGGCEGLASWADKMHKSHPERMIGISEYGAGGSEHHHQEKFERTNPGAYWHPEAYQAYYHEENWKIINERDFIWGT